jgi:hypothetical protein
MKPSADVVRASGWICPACRRRFARARQSHSCRPHSIDSHFAGKDPVLRALFDGLIRRLDKTGPLRIDAVKTSINLIGRHHFAGIAVRRQYLRVGFLARKPIRSRRIVHSLVLGPNRVEHSVVVHDRDDVDAELVRWLSDARRLHAS